MLITMVLLLEFALCRVALGLGFCRRPGANRCCRDLEVVPLSFGFCASGPLVRESDRLHEKLEFGAEGDRIRAMLECAGETDLSRTVLESFFQSQECCSRFALLGGLRALKEFNPVRRVSSVVLVERHPVLLLPVIPSLPLVLSPPSSRVHRVNAALHENSHPHNLHARLHENSLDAFPACFARCTICFEFA